MHGENWRFGWPTIVVEFIVLVAATLLPAFAYGASPVLICSRSGSTTTHETSWLSNIPEIGLLTGGGRQLTPQSRTPYALLGDVVAAKGAASAANIANKVNHIFREGKSLERLVQASGGSAEAAYRGVQQAANEALRSGVLKPGANGILPGAGRGAILNVNGVNVQLIGGRVIDGEVQIGSFLGLP